MRLIGLSCPRERGVGRAGPFSFPPDTSCLPQETANKAARYTGSAEAAKKRRLPPRERKPDETRHVQRGVVACPGCKSGDASPCPRPIAGGPASRRRRWLAHQRHHRDGAI